MTLTNSDVIDGTITQKEGGYAKAEFRLKLDTSITDDEDIVITEDYTDHSGTSSTTIFEGIIEDYTLEDVKTASSTSKQDEVERIKPIGVFQGNTTVVLSKIIENFGDYITASYGPTSYNYYYDAPYNFAAMYGKTNTDIDFVDSINGISATIASYDDGDAAAHSAHTYCLTLPCNSNSDYIKHSFEEQSSGLFEFWVICDDWAGKVANSIKDGDTTVCYCDIRSDDFYYCVGAVDTAWGGTHTPVNGDWYHISLEWNGDNTYNIEIRDHAGNHINGSPKSNIAVYTNGKIPDNYIAGAVYATTVNCTIRLDAIGEDWISNYTKGDNLSVISYNLPASSNSLYVDLKGGETLKSLLDVGAQSENYVWCLAPDGDLRWTDGATASGVSLTSANRVWDVSARYLNKRINTVHVIGAGGLTATVSDSARVASAGQAIIYKVYRANITNSTDLYTIANAILDIQKNPPMKLQISLDYEAVGWIQLGETVAIAASSFKYNNSSSYVPAGNYRVVGITYHISDGAYDYVELDLESGLYYTIQTTQELVDNNTQNAANAYGGSITVVGGIDELLDDESPELGGDLYFNNYAVADRAVFKYTDQIDLDAISGAMVIGGDGTSTHICIDDEDIQAKSDATTATNLRLNAFGGSVYLGPNSYITTAGLLTLGDDLVISGNALTLGTYTTTSASTLLICTDSEYDPTISLREEDSTYGFDLWYDGSANTFYISRLNGGAATAALSISRSTGAINIVGTLTAGYYGSHLLPATTTTYDLGSSSYIWRYSYTTQLRTYSSSTPILMFETGTTNWTRLVFDGNQIRFDWDDDGDGLFSPYTTALTMYSTGNCLVGAALVVTGACEAASFSTTGSITVGGNVDGVDIAAFYSAYGSHRHDGHTLNCDAISSNAGAFSFTTTGLVTFNYGVKSTASTGFYAGVQGTTTGRIQLYGSGSNEGGEIQLDGATGYGTAWYIDRYQNNIRFHYDGTIRFQVYSTGNALVGAALVVTGSCEAASFSTTGNITVGGTVDGKDVSGLCTTAEAQQYVEDTGLVLSASKSINIDGSPADATYTGIVMDIDTTGCATYDAVYIDGTNSVLPADADQITTMPAIGIVVAAGKVLTHGVVRHDATFAVAAASKVYVSTTAGDLTTTAPSGTGDIVQVFGITVGADMIFVNPSLDWITVIA